MPKEKDRKPASINLIRRMEKGVSDKFLMWAFTVGRGILMVVYAVALGAFLYRIVLDRQIIDLRDSIEQSQTRVTLAQQNETKFRDLQEKLSFIKESKPLATDEVELLDTIINLATGRILFTSLTISQSTVQMDGSVQSITALNGFVEDVKGIPAVKNVALDRLESRVDQGIISFSLTASL